MKEIIKKIFYPIEFACKKANCLVYDIRAGIKSRRKCTVTGKNSLCTKKRNDLIFYICCFTVPILFFILNHIVINGNSFLLAFKHTDYLTGISTWAGFKNFSDVFNKFIQDQTLKDALSRSLYTYIMMLPIITFLPIIFSYYIYKKKPGFKFFKIILFIPSIISGIITVTIFKTITERMIPDLYEIIYSSKIEGLLSNPLTTFDTVLFYNIWLSFGGGLLIQLAAMNTVDESVKESAALEGIGFFQELWYIVLPATYQILAISFITGIAGIFTTDLGLFAFFGLGADARVWTLGYYFTTRTMNATVFEYPFYAAWGLITSFIAIPVTLLLRYFIFKYGPSEE